MTKQTRWIGTFIIVLVFGAIACQACSRIGGESGDQENTTASTAAEAPSDSEQAGVDTESSAADQDDSDPSADADIEGDQSAAEEADGEQTDETAPAIEPTLIPTDEPIQKSGEDSADETGEDAPADEQNSDVGDTGEDSTDSDSDDTSSTGDSAVASGPSETACDHPYLPLRLGATWTFDNDGEILTWEVIEVQGDEDNAMAILRISVSDITLDSTWSCSSEEGLSSYNFADYGFGDLGADMSIELKSAEGSFLLPADQLLPGATWELYMESTINFSQVAGDETLVVTGDMINVQSNEVVGVDLVEFDGQTVDGIQIQQANAIDLVLNMLGISTEQSFPASNNFNLGKGIGIISQTSISDFGTSTMNLISYNIP